MNYADGKNREFYKVGISANTTAILACILGITDKQFLSKTHAEKIGEASITGCCIKFKNLLDINVEVLAGAVGKGFETQ